MRKESIRIGTRASLLALWQANHVRDLLLQAWPDVTMELVKISTLGDRTINQPLRQIGGKGLFLKEIETALGLGEIDVAVHSLKDVPFDLPDGLKLGACLKRDDVRDVLILAAAEELASGMVIGTGSLRRRAQLGQLHPGVIFADIRGNIDTRFAKLESDDYDGIMLSAAGLERMGWLDRATVCFNPEQIIPAAGQGAITLEIRTNDPTTEQLVATVHDEATGRLVAAERSFTRTIGGDCSLPVAAWCRAEDDKLKLLACIADLDHTKILRATSSGSTHDPISLGESVANEILQHGGDAIVAQYKNLTHNQGNNIVR